MKQIYALIATIFLLNITNIFAEPKPLASFKVENNWFFLDNEGKSFIPAQSLEGVGSLSEEKFFVKKRKADSSYFCYYNLKGKELFKVNSSIPFNFNYGVALTVKFLDEKGEKRLYGFINDKGEYLYDNVLEDALDFSDSLAYIQKGELRGYIDLSGKLAFQIDSMHIGYRFSEGKAPVSNNDFKFSFIDKTGKTVIPFLYDEVGEFKEGLCKAYTGSKFGFINHNNDLVINGQFDDTRNFSESFAFVGSYIENFEMKWGFINRDGRIIEDYIYDKIRDFSDGLAAVNKNGKWGFINTKGETVLDFIYSDADSFVDGLAFVADKKNNKAGYIDKKGNFVYSIVKFDMLIDFRTNERFYSFNNK